MKALIKHELRNIWAMTIAFVLIAVATGVGLYSQMESVLRAYIAGWDDRGISFIDVFWGFEKIYMVFMLGGLILLVICQFREHKSIGVGNFLASLPYTHRQVYGVKLGMGIASYTISFILFCMSIVGAWIQNIGWIREVERTSRVGEYLKLGNKLSDAIWMAFIVYGVITITYLFLCMMQYIISNYIGSIIISILVIGAVPYTIIGLDVYLVERLKLYSENLFTRKIGDVLVNFFDFCSYKGVSLGNISEGYTYSRYNYMDDLMGWRLLVIISLMLFLGVVIHWLSSTYGLGKQSTLIVSNVFEWIFKIGVAICSLFIPIFIGEMFAYGGREGMVIEISAVVVGIIGYVIASKIIQIGKQ